MALSATLNTGAEIPTVGLGLWKSGEGEVKQAVLEALKQGVLRVGHQGDCRNAHDAQFWRFVLALKACVVECADAPCSAVIVLARDCPLLLEMFCLS